MSDKAEAMEAMLTGIFEGPSPDEPDLCPVCTRENDREFVEIFVEHYGVPGEMDVLLRFHPLCWAKTRFPDEIAAWTEGWNATDV